MKKFKFGKLILLAIVVFLGFSVYKFFMGSGPNVEDITNKYTKGSPYVTEIQIKQNHLSLSLKKHGKDLINSFDFKIPVTKAYYDSVQKNEVLVDDFRMGSLLTEGSVGSWKVSVEDKIKQDGSTKKAYTNGKDITVSIEQNHFSLNPFKHIKDSMNGIELEIEVNDAYYNEINEGDVLVKEFRWGSLFSEGSVGNWEVKVIDK